jgi:hypothetical protein
MALAPPPNPFAVARAQGAGGKRKRGDEDEEEEGVARSPAPPPPPPPEGPRVASLWADVAVATARFFAQSADARRRRLLLRSTVDVVVDPLCLREGGAAADQGDGGTRCEGDERLRAIQEMLDQFGVERHDIQKLWHWHMTAAMLPTIYGRDWPRASHRVLRSMGLTELRREVLIQTFRRGGKTYSVLQRETARDR